MSNYSKRKQRLALEIKLCMALVTASIILFAALVKEFGAGGTELFQNFSHSQQAADLEEVKLSYAFDATGWAQTVDICQVPSFDSEPYIPLHGNVPYFTEAEINSASDCRIDMSALDSSGRVGPVTAVIGRELMPGAEEQRGEIGEVYPTGWNQRSYSFIEYGWVYNRCHVVGWQLCGLNAEPRNLITGTRYFNVEGMLPNENEVASYVRRTGNHVLYRVTPVFYEDEALARGAVMEAFSLEDHGEGVCYCVYCYNVQPGVKIDYVTGKTEQATGWLLPAPGTAQIA